MYIGRVLAHAGFFLVVSSISLFSQDDMPKTKDGDIDFIPGLTNKSGPETEKAKRYSSQLRKSLRDFRAFVLGQSTLKGMENAFSIYDTTMNSIQHDFSSRKVWISLRRKEGRLSLDSGGRPSIYLASYYLHLQESCDALMMAKKGKVASERLWRALDAFPLGLPEDYGEEVSLVTPILVRAYYLDRERLSKWARQKTVAVASPGERKFSMRPLYVFYESFSKSRSADKKSPFAKRFLYLFSLGEKHIPKCWKPTPGQQK